MFGDLGKMMKQVNEMKKQMKEVENELSSLILKSSAKDNLVEIEITGKMDLKSLKIKPELIALNDHKKIEKIISDTVKDAIATAKDTAAQKLSKVTGGLSLPGIG